MYTLKQCNNKNRIVLSELIQYNNGMSVARVISHKVHYAKKDWWRKNRILFPSPAEVQFARVMGGKAITIDHIKHPQTGFPLTIITSMGKTLRREFVQREVRVGAMYVDFGFETRYSKKAIEIDGDAFHRDIVREQERDEYCRERGWKLLHIQAADIYREPDLVQRRVMKFLAY